MNSITEKRLEKVKFLDNIFKKFEKSKLPPTVFCKLKGIHTSKFYYWWGRYKKMGTKGLVDRREGVAYKVTKEIKEYIRDIKIKDQMNYRTVNDAVSQDLLKRQICQGKFDCSL
jgi:hypothetical protein